MGVHNEGLHYANSRGWPPAVDLYLITLTGRSFIWISHPRECVFSLCWGGFYCRSRRGAACFSPSGFSLARARYFSWYYRRLREAKLLQLVWRADSVTHERVSKFPSIHPCFTRFSLSFFVFVSFYILHLLPSVSSCSFLLCPLSLMFLYKICERDESFIRRVYIWQTFNIIFSILFLYLWQICDNLRIRRLNQFWLLLVKYKCHCLSNVIMEARSISSVTLNFSLKKLWFIDCITNTESCA